MKIIVPLLAIIFFLIRYLIKSKKVNRIPQNNMDSCFNCGTFVSKDLAIKRGDKIFCSDKCVK